MLVYMKRFCRKMLSVRLLVSIVLNWISWKSARHSLALGWNYYWSNVGRFVGTKLAMEFEVANFLTFQVFHKMNEEIMAEGCT